jgi:uncharacterized protein YcnI
MKPVLLAAAAAAALALVPAAPAVAHVTLETPQAAPDTWYRAVFRVPHGCDGAATIRLTVRLPESITRARPMPKPGWTLTLAPREGAPPPTGHGAAPEIAAVTWEGGRLLDAHYDEFVIRFRTPATPGEVWIPVRQDCEGGRSIEWAQTPGPGERAPTPAPRLVVLAR